MIDKNQTIKIETLISLNNEAFQTVLNKQETINEYRLNRVMEALKTGTELPAIQVAGTDCSIIDGRHRLVGYWLMGYTTIQADVHWAWD